jgi:hypothetical protein
VQTGSDILAQFRELPAGMGCSFYFEDVGSQPLFSYVQLDEDGWIVKMAEKKKISSKANTGAYGFSRCVLICPIRKNKIKKLTLPCIFCTRGGLAFSV